MLTLQWYVRRYSHLEYGEGFMIFDREDGNKEVWGRTADIPCTTRDGSAVDSDPQTEPGPKFDPASVPDARQIHVSHLLILTPPSLTPSTSSASSAPARSQNSKAHFTPHALLHMPEPTSAFRFVYPHLLVASLERAFVWDVRTGKIIETLEGIQPDNQEGEGEEDRFPRVLGRVRYVDISPRHLFFVGGTLLRVFSRKTGECVLDIPSTRWQYGGWKWEVTSRASNKGVDVGQGVEWIGTEEGDSYAEAKENGREVVRVPTRCSFEKCWSAVSGRQAIDQFIGGTFTSVFCSNLSSIYPIPNFFLQFMYRVTACTSLLF